MARSGRTRVIPGSYQGGSRVDVSTCRHAAAAAIFARGGVSRARPRAATRPRTSPPARVTSPPRPPLALRLRSYRVACIPPRQSVWSSVEQREARGVDCDTSHTQSMGLPTAPLLPLRWLTCTLRLPALHYRYLLRPALHARPTCEMPVRADAERGCHGAGKARHRHTAARVAAPCTKRPSGAAIHPERAQRAWAPERGVGRGWRGG